MNDILSVSSLAGTTNDAIIPSGGATYILGHAVLTHESAATYLGTSPGLGQSSTNTAQMALSASNLVTFSITDFNELRINVADSLLKIDKKIDEILNIATLSCETARDAWGLWNINSPSFLSGTTLGTLGKKKK